MAPHFLPLLEARDQRSGFPPCTTTGAVGWIRYSDSARGVARFSMLSYSAFTSASRLSDKGRSPALSISDPCRPSVDMPVGEDEFAVEDDWAVSASVDPHCLSNIPGDGGPQVQSQFCAEVCGFAWPAFSSPAAPGTVRTYEAAPKGPSKGPSKLQCPFYAPLGSMVQLGPHFTVSRLGQPTARRSSVELVKAASASWRSVRVSGRRKMSMLACIPGKDPPCC